MTINDLTREARRLAKAFNRTNAWELQIFLSENTPIKSHEIFKAGYSHALWMINNYIAHKAGMDWAQPIENNTNQTNQEDTMPKPSKQKVSIQFNLEPKQEPDGKYSTHKDIARRIKELAGTMGKVTSMQVNNIE